MVDVRCPRDGSVSWTPAHETALEVLQSGIEAAHPATRVAETLSIRAGQLSVESVDGTTASYDLESYDDVVVVGGGNAAGAFAAALEDRCGDLLADGVVVTDAPAETTTVDVLSGDHPLPSAEGVRHSRRVLETARSATANDLLVTVVTGGASALLAVPDESLSVSDLRAVTKELLACGATIEEINAVRKHCSAIKGGRLARAGSPATVLTLVLSDVVGDDPGVIGSGPTAPDSSTDADARAVIDRYELSVPKTVRAHLEAGDDGDRQETPTADDPLFDRVDTFLLGSNRTALEAARAVATERGYTPLVLSARVRGEAREAALTHVAIAEECRETGAPVEPPAVVLSGGETTVSLCDTPGRGGPNQEFVTSGAIALDAEDVVVASVDTDGIDGGTDAAGAIADATTIPVDAGRTALEENDVYPLLEAEACLIRTGPTGTNVNDLRALVIAADD